MPKKRGGGGSGKSYRPVRVYKTARAETKNIPVTRSIKNINKAVGSSVLRQTPRKKKADIVVGVSQAPKKKKQYQGQSSRIPTSRKQIERKQTKVVVQPSAAAKKNAFSLKKPVKGSVRPRTLVTTHELGHAVGLTHHDKLFKKTEKTQQRVPKSLMSGGVKLTGYDARTISRVTGAPVRKKASTAKVYKGKKGQR